MGVRQVLASKIVEGVGGCEVMNKLTGGLLLLCCLIAFLLGSFFADSTGGSMP